MKKTFFLPALFFLPLLTSAVVFGQSGRNDTRLRNMEKSIERIEQRMEKAELQMMMGDSLIQYGDQQIAQADKDFYRIADEVKKMNKEYRARRKRFEKLAKSSDRETALEAKQEIRMLDENRRNAIREYSFEVRDMKKKAMKGDSDIKKGQSLQSMAAKSIKSSRRDLRDAQERYDMTLSTLNR
ncbi:MAG: hypothetical protein JW801_17645 [Bacteroidales bacterium]|nr:hypothetical protein [Bacteroidales bacterium]